MAALTWAIRSRRGAAILEICKFVTWPLVAQGDGKEAPLSSISTEPRAGGFLMSDPRGPSPAREASSTDIRPRCSWATAIRHAVPALEP